VASIVENMLSFARKSDASFSTHDPAVLMDKVLVLAETDYDLKNHNDFKSIALEKRYEAHLPPVVCESGKIQQVILNILNNGAYAMFESEKDVAPKFVLRLNRETASNMLRIEIEDNGPGMDENTAKQIFDPFFTTKPVGAGTGLGLSVSYFIITETHNGSMDVVSEPGRGATFIIRLPLD
ncbi:MAG: ATP-binding protein, partial [Desulfobacterales bacterium]|nr:ATP-binding protein [Desulfobacterales bacterium]